jgi:hypothetical protein
VDQSAAKVWFGSFSSAHPTLFPGRFSCLFVTFSATVQVTLLSLARLERSRTPKRHVWEPTSIVGLRMYDGHLGCCGNDLLSVSLRFSISYLTATFL